MNVNGVVIAKSESIRIQAGTGVLLLVYNAIMNFHFCILVSGDVDPSREKIMVNNCYQFMNLKIGAFKLASSFVKYLLKTTFQTVYVKIKSSMMTEFKTVGRIKRLIFNPGIKASFHSPFSKLISYQGIVTDIVDPAYGIYELDGKILLFATSNKFRSSLISLSKNSQVFASNVHFVSGFQDEKVLVCCGLSSLQELSAVNQQADECVDVDTNFSLEYPFSIFDILWLQKLFLKLNMKFTSFMGLTENIFRWNIEFIHNVVQHLTRPWEDFHTKDTTILEEFFSCPHLCLPFSEDILPTGCNVPFVAEFLNIDSCIKYSCSRNWKICFTRNEGNSILIGVLYIKDGAFHIADKSYSFPVVFTKSCSSCYNEENIMCKFPSADTALLIALQEFDIVTEEIKNFATLQKISYLKASHCSLFPLSSFFKTFNKSSLVVLENSFKNLSLNVKKSQNHFNINEKNAHIEGSSNLSSSSVVSALNQSCSLNTDHLLNCTLKSNEYRFFIWNNLWTKSKNVSGLLYFLVWFLPLKNKTDSFVHSSNKKLDNDDYNFYGTGDDIEFADLINKMDAVFLETNVKFAIMEFDSKEHCIPLLPSHSYTINCATENIFLAENLILKSRSSPVLLKISSSSSIVHSPDCLGNNFEDFSEAVKFYTVKDVLLRRMLLNDEFLRAVLTDKFSVDECNNSSNGKFYDHKQKMLSCCLVVKDIVYQDYMHVYVTLKYSVWVGLLPNMELELYGFNCFSSKKGFLYLKPTSMFGIKVSGFENNYYLDKHFSLVDEKYISFEDTMFHLPAFEDASMKNSFRLFCFVTKIESAEVYLLCKKCHQNSLEGCFCSSTYDVNIRISAYIDDGSKQTLAEFQGNAAKQLLELQQVQWDSLASCVQEKCLPLEYDSKMVDEELICYPLLNQVFSAYCSCQFLCRQMLMECKFSNKGIKEKITSLLVINVLDYKTENLARECYGKLLNTSFK